MEGNNGGCARHDNNEVSSVKFEACPEGAKGLSQGFYPLETSKHSDPP